MSAPQIKAPIPTNASKATVSQIARIAAESFGYAPGVPIESVISDIGGTISYDQYTTNSTPESICVQPDGKFEIFLSPLTSIERDRFTIAHELGHLLLHFPLVQVTSPESPMRATRWVDDSDPDLQRCEWEANWFAAAFLMPEDLFKEMSATRSTSQLASFFGVSSRAVEIRKRSLEL